jgi:hypothetical protein
MTTKTYTSRDEARISLLDKGMKRNREAHSLDHGSDREYWGFFDGTDRLYDHSATITRTGLDSYAVSDFTA